MVHYNEMINDVLLYLYNNKASEHFPQEYLLIKEKIMSYIMYKFNQLN